MPLDSSVVASLLSDLEAVRIAPIPGGVLGLDGTSYYFSVKRGFNQFSLRWWAKLPAAWESLNPLLRRLVSLAGDRASDVHIRVVCAAHLSDEGEFRMPMLITEVLPAAPSGHVWRLACLAIAILIGGCASSSTTYGPDGRQAHTLNTTVSQNSESRMNAGRPRHA